MKQQPLRLLLRWALITASLSGLLFLAAGTSHIASLRAYLALFSAWLLVTMLAVDPRLAGERAHPRKPGINDGLRFATGSLFLLTLTVAALSVGRLHPVFMVPTPIRDGALVVFAVSASLQAWAMIVNPFFSPVVRLQTECGHRLIESGPYKFMRHPGYFAMLISTPASAVAIGSWLALLPSIAFALVIAQRTRVEDNFLRCNLTGYAAYANNVPGRLLPLKQTRKNLYVKHST
jgi:protein-S-isoprenylcysteine O-methyltransferase Ste14